jgi:hypothetical protein
MAKLNASQQVILQSISDLAKDSAGSFLSASETHVARHHDLHGIVAGAAASAWNSAMRSRNIAPEANWARDNVS